MLNYHCFSNESIFIVTFQLPFDVFLCLLHCYIHIPIQTCKNTYTWRLKGIINACKCMFFIVRCTKQQSAVYLQRVGLKHSQHLLHFSHHYHPTERNFIPFISLIHIWLCELWVKVWKLRVSPQIQYHCWLYVGGLMVVYRILVAKSEIYLWGATHKIRKLIFFSVYILITSIFFNGKLTSFNWKRSTIKKQRETLSTVKLITSILHIKLKMVMHIQFNNQ